MFLAIPVGLYRLSNGMLGGRLGPFKVLLLTTTGRKSGQLHTTPLGLFERPNGYVVVASNSGSDHQPAWYLNLKSNPKATVQVFEKVIPVTGEVLSGQEREDAWQQVIGSAPQYANYQKKTTRQIPLVLLHPDR